jgi:hypothetical protein
MVPAEGLLGATRLALPLTLRGRPKGRSPPSLRAGVVEPACLSVGGSNCRRMAARARPWFAVSL